MRSTALLIVIALGAAPACSPAATSGGQTGEESGACRIATYRDLARDEASPGGVVPNDVVGLVSGRYDAELSWSEGAMAEDGTSTGMHLEFTAHEGPARYVEDANCSSYVAVSGDFRFRTDDGSFDEVRDATVRADNAEHAEASFDFGFEKLTGSYDVARLLPEGYVAESGLALFSFRISDQERTVEGTLRGSAELEGPKFDRIDLRVGTISGSAAAPAPPAGTEACQKGFSREDPGDRVCRATYLGTCFESDPEACACAGCPENCVILESYPTQIHCE